ncbi:DUF4065 domain-containing protein [Puteibacter caeruleilacunae]|nr:DUF4065 domain-containing protein [Puteibacter caeruleilacunae]
MNTYSREEIEKIANTILFFIERIPELSKTKLLKLLFLAEEAFVKKHQIPFLGLEFEVWQAGPVARDIFIDLSDEPFLLKEFISLDKTNQGTFIHRQKEFSDDEFNDNELNLLQLIVDKFGNKTASELVKYTHRKSSNWYHVAKNKNLLDLFENGHTNSSAEKIDFLWYLDEKGKEIYLEQNSFNGIVRSIN